MRREGRDDVWNPFGEVVDGLSQAERDDIERARADGADDKAIHDTVLIAAAFCMFNRYVDGLGTWSPEDPADYVESGVRLAEHGYAKFDFSKIRGEWRAEGR